MSLNAEKIRADFPILATETRGRPLTYLDSAASAQKPKAVIDAMAEAGLTLIKDASEATGEVLSHTHGKEVGDAAKASGEVLSNVYQSAVNLRSVGVTAIAKKTLINGTKELVEGGAQGDESEQAAAGTASSSKKETPD